MSRVFTHIRVTSKDEYYDDDDDYCNRHSIADQDGYLLVEEVQAVIDSYNMVYKLNIPQSAITEAFKCCSNGMLVDFDTFLRIVATKRA